MGTINLDMVKCKKGANIAMDALRNAGFDEFEAFGALVIAKMACDQIFHELGITPKVIDLNAN